MRRLCNTSNAYDLLGARPRDEVAWEIRTEKNPRRIVSDNRRLD